MKVRASVKKICDKCKVIQAQGHRADHLPGQPPSQAAPGLTPALRRTRMARIAGVDLPREKRIEISLQYIYGIGKTTAQAICEKANVNVETRTKDLTDDEIRRIRETIEQNVKVEGDLRRETSMNIKRLMDLGCYRGLRHRKGLPARGQRTHTNARTRKGPKRGSSRKPRPRPRPRRNAQSTETSMADEKQTKDEASRQATRSRRPGVPNLTGIEPITSPVTPKKGKKRVKKNVAAGIVHIAGDLQQHDDHDHRPRRAT